MTMSDRRFYLKLEDTRHILCIMPDQPSPQWWGGREGPSNGAPWIRLGFDSIREAAIFRSWLEKTWPEFKAQTIRICRIEPPTEERILDAEV